MEQAVLDLIVDRLERIEKQNDDQLKLLHSHMKEQNELATVVGQHKTYFKLVGSTFGIGIPLLLSYLGNKLGFK